MSEDIEPVGNLTIVWDKEKHDLFTRLEKLESYEHDAKVDILNRLDKLELQMESIAHELAAVVSWAKQLKREPTIFTQS